MHMRKSQKFGFEKGRVPRKPLRTASEMAEELGVSHRHLVSAMNVDPTGPRPQLKNGSRACPASWYEPGVARAWWRKRQDQAASAASASQAERA